MKQIIIYVDQGVSGPALKQTMRSLQQEVDESSHAIKRMDAAALLSEKWEDETALLLIPAGRDVYYHQLLEGKGTDKIRSFIHNGGNYLGICAGAYFASRYIQFEKGGQLEICGERSLGFFPGTAEGPAYGLNKYVYDSEKGAEAAHIFWGKEFYQVYFNGGCLFADPSSHKNTSVLANYANLPLQPAAIVECKVGNGKAILTGVHMEYSAHSLNAEINPDLHAQLLDGEEKRRRFFREILQRLTISQLKTYTKNII